MAFEQTCFLIALQPKFEWHDYDLVLLQNSIKIFMFFIKHFSPVLIIFAFGKAFTLLAALLSSTSHRKEIFAFPLFKHSNVGLSFPNTDTCN
jgi:hypothetical protein